MKDVTQLRSLADMRTTISTHARSTPKQKGSTFLNIYLLDKEKQRLETELSMLGKRQKRIEGRLSEIREAMEGLMTEREQDTCTISPASPATRKSQGAAPESQDWKRVTIEY